MKKRETLYLLLTILILVLLRVPGICFWNNYLTGDDASVHAEKGIHLAQGKGFTCSVVRYMHYEERAELLDYIDKFGNTAQEVKVAPLYIFMISGLYSLFGEQNYMLSINLLNLLIFIATLLVIFFFLTPMFTSDILVRVVTLWFVGLNTLFFEGYFGAHMEPLWLFMFVCAYVLHVSVIKKDVLKAGELMLYSLALVLLFLSKYNSIPFVGAFVLHHLVQRKYKRFLLVGTVVFVLAGAWFFLRDILTGGRAIADFAMTFFPEGRYWIFQMDGVKEVMVKLKTNFMDFARMPANINGLSILLPFTLIYFITKPKDTSKSANWILIIMTVVFYMMRRLALLRYVYPVFVPLIPASLAVFAGFLDQYRPFVKKAVLAILVAGLFVVQTDQMLKITLAIRRQAPDRESIFLAADKLLEDNGVSSENSVLTNILGYNVYTDVGIVMAPDGLTEANKKEVMDVYHIDHVLFCSDQMETPIVWDQYVVKEDVFTDLSLVAVSDFDKRVRLYKVYTP